MRSSARRSRKCGSKPAAPSFGILSKKLFKTWLVSFITYPPGPVVSSYVTSPDGLHWSKPVLGRYEVLGSTQNNFVAYGAKYDHPTAVILNVVYHPDAPLTSRYKGFIWGEDRKPVVSSNGLDWQRLDVPPIASMDESVLTFDPHTATFIATLKASGPHGRAVSLATSKDFNQWTKPELVFFADDRDQELGRQNIAERLKSPWLQQPVFNDPSHYNVDVYNMPAFRYEGLYIGLPAMYHATGPYPTKFPNTDGFHLVQLTCSRDLMRWRRLGDRQPFIGPSAKGAGAYDLMQILGPAEPVVKDDELWFYYTGIKYRAGCFEYVGGDYPNGTLRIKPGLDQDIGAVLPGRAAARRVHVSGRRRCERHDRDKAVRVARRQAIRQRGCHRRRVAGRGRRRRRPGSGGLGAARGDLLRGEPKWQQGSIADLKGKAVTLRLTLRNASLYSYWLQ